MGWGFEDEYDEDDDDFDWIDSIGGLAELLLWAAGFWIAYAVIPSVIGWLWAFMMYVWPWSQAALQ